jgi:hypothetical protein
MGWNPTELHLDAHKYTEETQAGGIRFRVCVSLFYVSFFVLCNRHWFNKAPGPDLRGLGWGLPIYPSLLAQTLAVPIYPYPYWEPQSTSGLW